MENQGTITVAVAKSIGRRFTERMGDRWYLDWRVKQDGSTAHDFAVRGAQSLRIPLKATTPHELVAELGGHAVGSRSGLPE